MLGDQAWKWNQIQGPSSQAWSGLVAYRIQKETGGACCRMWVGSQSLPAGTGYRQMWFEWPRASLPTLVCWQMCHITGNSPGVKLPWLALSC